MSNELAFTTLYQGFSCIHLRHAELITTPDRYEELWNQHQGDSLPLPEVDFSRNSVLAVFAGHQPDTGCYISVLNVEDTDNSLIVQVADLRKPGAHMQASLRPAHIVQIPAVSGTRLIELRTLAESE